ncbi:NADH-quinone oxidoreductase subunit A [Candidatus Palibaumannia cicadellinicola]|uniref:NADH-quinone oxidoreductase subunit A n=1 Tax=Baumannia cicadellinicola subsp. Homalodisca coagulata TaxID=374463 RepID=NUOA_BAUCH|nr:NADH-quinone oxidoreductase subunit A [Candidatus Baumannia cicadellinicola]Q1LT89.1 RecName: Full=NADH-quinone oxidoreductase subunit A; AltName: Full=NADH dehydrogenase I subunit A; AltName: Full=NDH-1 subunit A; AltName: Full=NUO1 [Baumannia cicadellinicola str. Hc (Homalodisca coagulata)]ABF14283.1 NADH-quinone oxidoreductase, subunit A [Baumannia cicadellinicola str. Hc (Homalodisca coagulata)]MCJ7462479.1 NADH-quinone oxidoreductase subunit A [Candidatus Baumannia cicadellinicola]MCJ74
MTAEISAQYWAFAIFIISAIILCVLILTLSFLLGERKHIKVYSRDLPFESGINPVGNPKLHLSAKFYLIAIFFVLFDIEAFYLYAWSSVIREAGWLGFYEAIIFVSVLLSGLVYLVRIGALKWTPNHS